MFVTAGVLWSACLTCEHSVDTCLCWLLTFEHSVMIILQPPLDCEAKTDQKRRLYFFSSVGLEWRSRVFTFGLFGSLET